MADYFIGYDTTVNIALNEQVFMNKYIGIIEKLHKQQEVEEETKAKSYAQYKVMTYYIALEYCINLLFLSLERLEDETKLEAEDRVKKKHNFKRVQVELAHKGIDLNDIYNDISINHTPVEYEN